MGNGGCSGAIHRQDPLVDFGEDGARGDWSSPRLQHGGAALSPAFLQARKLGVCFWRLCFGDGRMDAAGGLKKGCFCHSH